MMPSSSNLRVSSSITSGFSKFCMFRFAGRNLCNGASSQSSLFFFFINIILILPVNNFKLNIEKINAKLYCKLFF